MHQPFSGGIDDDGTTPCRWRQKSTPCGGRCAPPRVSSELHVHELLKVPCSQHDQADDERVVRRPSQRHRTGCQPLPDRAPLVEELDQQKQSTSTTERLHRRRRKPRPDERRQLRERLEHARQDGRRVRKGGGPEEHPRQQDEVEGREPGEARRGRAPAEERSGRAGGASPQRDSKARCRRR